MNTRAGFEDQLLTCIDCCADFVWPTDEQEFYRQKGYAPPEGCGRCCGGRGRSSRTAESRKAACGEPAKRADSASRAEN